LNNNRLLDPELVMIDRATGRMETCTSHYQRRLSQVADIYVDADACRRFLDASGDVITYEVYEHLTSETEGDVIFGTSIVHPGKVGREYFMTRGHSHAKADRAEIYFCLAGCGLMLMESPDGRPEAVRMKPMGVVYVPPFWKHRSVNTGSERMISFFSYPADAGHEYGTIEQFGMRKIVVERNGTPELEDNPNYGGDEALLPGD